MAGPKLDGAGIQKMKTLEDATTDAPAHPWISSRRTRSRVKKPADVALRCSDQARAAAARRSAQGAVRDDRRPGRGAESGGDARGERADARCACCARASAAPRSAIDIAIVRVKENHAEKEATPRARRGSASRLTSPPRDAERARGVTSCRGKSYRSRHRRARCVALIAPRSFPRLDARHESASRNRAVALLPTLPEQGSRMPVPSRPRRLTTAALPALAAVALTACNAQLPELHLPRPHGVQSRRRLPVQDPDLAGDGRLHLRRGASSSTRSSAIGGGARATGPSTCTATRRSRSCGRRFRRSSSPSSPSRPSARSSGRRRRRRPTRCRSR